MSHSKAGLYPYTRHPINNRAEPTFALLRYFLGGYRPSKTDQLPMSLNFFDFRLELSILKGGVSLATHLTPKDQIQSLPLTLSIETENTITAYSKGA